jgi:hypothetical protein
MRAQLSKGNNDGKQNARRKQGSEQPPKKAKIILLGVHLCGSLSLRAIQLVNENPSTIALACVKPCCLPSKKQLASQTYYTLGNHRFETAQVYFPQRYSEDGEPIESGDSNDWEGKDTVAEKTTAEKTPKTVTTATDLVHTVTTSVTTATTSTTTSNNNTYNNSNINDTYNNTYNNNTYMNNDDDDVNDLADEESDEENEKNLDDNENDASQKNLVSKFPKRISHRRRKFNAWCQHVYSCLDCAGPKIATNGIEIGDLEVVCPEVERPAGVVERNLRVVEAVVEQPEQLEQANSRNDSLDNRRTVHRVHDNVVVEKTFATQTIVPDGFQNKLIFVERDLHKYAQVTADSAPKPIAVQGQIVFRGKEMKKNCEIKKKKRGRVNKSGGLSVAGA